MNGQLAGELTRLLALKKELLIELLESMRRSSCLLQEDDMEGFEGEMETWDGITAKVDELDLSAAHIREQMAGVQPDEIAAITSGIAEIGKQIELARQECNDIAQRKLLTYGQQIKSIRHTKRGIDGYAGQFVKRDAVFVDEKK